VTFLNPRQHRFRQRVGKMESDEVKPSIFFPMWKAATLPDAYLAETGLRRALNGALEFAGPR
jgi:hypothetical protein